MTHLDNLIDVSGVSQPPLLGIKFPSGLFPVYTPGADLNACLVSMNATFGFNLTPHQFDLEFVPIGGPGTFHGASGQLPPISSQFELFIGDFFLRGTVRHADYTNSIQGTIINVRVEDNRRQLRSVKIQSEDLGEDIPSGIVSIARAFRRINGLTDINGDPSDPLITEYRRILQFGATYPQLLNAIDFTFNEGKCSIPASELPSADKLEANIGGTIESLRFQFVLQTLDEAVSRVFQDSGFDWYWNMDANQLNLINKKSDFDITENSILDIVSEFGSASGLNETEVLGFGQDFVPEPTRFRLLGGHQQGFLNSALLSPIDGLDTYKIDVDGDQELTQIKFTKVWDRIAIGFNDHDGFYRTYIPTTKELQLALAGIEQWTYFKIYQNTPGTNDPPGYGLPIDAGSIAAQHFTFQSRFDPIEAFPANATSAGTSGIRIISNRRDSEHNWVLAFYQRVRDHASRHYGRSYILEGQVFNSSSGLYRPIELAWANVENQIQGSGLSPSGANGPFVEDYEINRSLGPISPFVADDFRVRAHAVLPADTVYGPDGNDVPASFGNWTEDAPPFNPAGDGSHYIPVEITEVGQRVINPRDDGSDLYGFEQFPEGTLWCQLPVNAGPPGEPKEDNTLKDLVTLVSTAAKESAITPLDIINPAVVLNAYDSLSGVAIPVEARFRYGQNYPTTWVTGEFQFEEDESVQLDDQFVPWAFSPMGTQTSLAVMTERALRRVTGKVIPSITSRYADFTQVGLPRLTFDSFADQNPNVDGLYGVTTHGVSELNVNFSGEGFITRYKVQSYFSKFGKEAPLGERVGAILNGILNPIDFTTLRLGLPTPPPNPLIPGNPLPPIIFVDSEKRAVQVTITSVVDNFTLVSAPPAKPERYRGINRNGYTLPQRISSSSNIDFAKGAVCIDGFLNIGDKALYHTDSFELPNGNVAFRYFTGGRAYANGTIVEVQNINASNSSNYDVTIVDPTADAAGITRALLNVPVLNGTVMPGDKTTLAVQGDGPITTGPSTDGVFLNASTTQGVIPAIVTAVSGQGTAGALCEATELGPDGNVLTGGRVFTHVRILPYPKFVSEGDSGFLSMVSVSSQVINYMLIGNKTGFFKFGS